MSTFDGKARLQPGSGFATVDYSYELPPSLIAQHPLRERNASRLLCLDGMSGAVDDRQFTDLETLVRPGDLMVLNDTKVLPARLYGAKDTGGRVEIMLERFLDDDRALVQIKASKSVRAGQRINIPTEDDTIVITVTGRDGDFFEVRSSGWNSLQAIFERCGHVPLPPYVRREDESEDRARYQTVYARYPGAVAAPTAGLHFSTGLLDRLRTRGVDIEFITLHVAAGTFQPVRTNDLREHRMHREHVEVSAGVCEAVHRARQRGGRVIAVGTTSVRALETSVRDGSVQPINGETGLFIYPGYRFHVVDVLLTNFHLPQSTLLMLVCAFAGTDSVLAAYRHAVARQYRFYSYGDATWMTPGPGARG